MYNDNFLILNIEESIKIVVHQRICVQVAKQISYIRGKV